MSLKTECLQPHQLQALKPGDKIYSTDRDYIGVGGISVVSRVCEMKVVLVLDNKVLAQSRDGRACFYENYMFYATEMDAWRSGIARAKEDLARFETSVFAVKNAITTAEGNLERLTALAKQAKKTKE